MNNTKTEIYDITRDLDDIRRNLMETETQLAQLHADIYKCREETRKIRLSMPTPDSLEKTRAKACKTFDKGELCKMRDRLALKKNKLLVSFQKVQEKLQRDFSKPKNYTWLFILLVASILFIIGKKYIKT